MGSHTKLKYFLEVAADLTVAMQELPGLIVDALHRHDEQLDLRKSALQVIQDQLAKDVQQGTLVVCNPKTLAAYSPPVSDEDLNDAVIIPETYLVEYLAARHGIQIRLRTHGLGPDYWTLKNAAIDVQKAMEWRGTRGKGFLSYLIGEAQKGEIPVFDPETLKEFDPAVRSIRPELDFVRSEDVWDCYFLGGDMYLVEKEFERWPACRISDVHRLPSLRDNKPWLTEETVDRHGLYLYEQAAWEIADAQKWNDATFQDFLLDLAFAIRSKELPIFKPRTGIAASPETQAKWYVSVDDVNDWLSKKSKTAFRWERAVVPVTDPNKGATSTLVKAKSKVRSLTWKDVAMPYVVQVYKSGQYSTAKDLYRAIERKAGSEGSPFDRGVGLHSHKLFVRDTGRPLAMKTFQGAWREIKTG